MTSKVSGSRFQVSGVRVAIIFWNPEPET